MARGRTGASSSLPGLRACVREAGSDFYYNSWRLVPVNTLWGAGVVCLLVVAGATPLAFVLTPLLAVPAIGIYRLAALIARGQPASLSDAFEAMRTHGTAALLTGLAFTAIVTVLGWNALAGVATAEPAGWALATLAAWGLVATVVVGVVLWPLLADPARDDQPRREAVRVAVAVVFACPARVALLAVLVAAILVASTIAFAAIVTISLAFVALVSSRFVLPAADVLAAAALGHAETSVPGRPAAT